MARMLRRNFHSTLFLRGIVLLLIDVNFSIRKIKSTKWNASRKNELKGRTKVSWNKASITRRCSDFGLVWCWQYTISRFCMSLLSCSIEGYANITVVSSAFLIDFLPVPSPYCLYPKAYFRRPIYFVSLQVIFKRPLFSFLSQSVNFGRW